MVATLPPWIDEVVLRLLAKVRDERFQSTEEFLDALPAGRESRRLAPEDADGDRQRGVDGGAARRARAAGRRGHADAARRGA